MTEASTATAPPPSSCSAGPGVEFESSCCGGAGYSVSNSSDTNAALLPVTNNSANNSNNGGSITNNLTQKTPPRNNYASQHTPIASIKRPRSSLEAANYKGRNNNQNTNYAVSNNNSGVYRVLNNNGVQQTPSSSNPEPPLSPLHPPKAVHRTCHHSSSGMVQHSAAGECGGSPDSGANNSTAMLEDDKEDIFSPVLKLDKGTSGLRIDGGHHGSSSNNGSDHADNDTEPTVESSVTNTVVILKETCSLDDDDDEDVLDATDNIHVDDDDDDPVNDHQSECSLSVTEPDHVDDDDFNPWQFIKSLPDYTSVRHLTPPVALPPRATNRYKSDLTVVLDLDETLVHCTVEPTEAYDFSFGVTFHGVEYQVYVRLRPNLYKFLELIQDQYEVVVFTASQRVYADELLNRIDPDKKFFHHRLFRESCLAVEGNFLKDLNVLGRDLTKTVLVDNSPHAFGYQLDNGIPIESWFDSDSDRELLKLERFLRQVANSPDVREDCRRKFLCRQRVQSAPDYSHNLASM